MTPLAKLTTTPFWSDSASLPRFPKLERDERADVVIVGGGITGLTAAYLLTVAGRSVAVLERDRCGQVDSGHTSAHLTMVVDQRITDLVKHFGRDHAQAVLDAGLAAIGQIDAIVRDELIKCHFEWVPGYLHAPRGVEPDRALFEEEAKQASELGFDATFAEDVPFVGGPGVLFEGQARFHPREYLAGLAQAITARGGRIFEHSSAQEFCDDPLSVRANDCTISCNHIVLATHTPLVGINNIASATLFQTKLALYTSYVIAGRMKRGTLPDALFWDTADPYHYLRIERHRDHDVVILGGEDHKTGQVQDTSARFKTLQNALLAQVPGITL